jgi:peptide/nickel transport system substrate-binding protein
VNRQPRALLSVLLIGLIAFLGWRWWSGNQPDAGDGAEIVISDVSTRGGTITSSLRSEPRTFNRIMDARVPTDLYYHLTSSKLVRVNRATQEVEAGVAEKWAISPDNLTYTLTLRDGVTWSDGAPFTSADVLFSFQAMYDPKTGSPLGGSLIINGKPLQVTAPDAKTVVITLPSTFGPGIALLDNVYLVPKHKYEAALKAGTFAETMGATTPPAELLSLGAFKLTTYTPGQRLVFDRNPRYWKKDNAGIQLPYLDQIVFEIVPDQNAELVRQQAGQFDLLQQQNRAEDLATLRPLEQQGKLRLIELGVSADPDPFFFNLRSSFWAKDPRGGWITRKEFRQAISHAIDREAFANTIFLGAAVPVWGPVTPGNTKWFSPNVQRYGYSQERAREILAGLGLTNRDADEWVEDPKGTEARFTVLAYRGNTQVERGAAFIRDELKKVGIAVDVALLEQGAVVTRIQSGDFEAAHITIAQTNLDPAMSPDLWLSSGSAHFWNIGQSKPATDWEKQIDDLMVTVMGSVDQAERRRAFDEIQKIFADHLPIIYFVAPRLYMGVSARVSGMRPSILRPQLLWDAEHMSVRQDR